MQDIRHVTFPSGGVRGDRSTLLNYAYQKKQKKLKTNVYHKTTPPISLNIVIRPAAVWDSMANASTQPILGKILSFSPNFLIVHDFGCGANWIKGMMGVYGVG